MSLIVTKFGGTSVGNAAAIEALVGITREQLAAWDHVVVVVSAMSGVTDMLIQGARSAAAGDRDAYPQIARRLREKHAAALTELIDDERETTAVRGQVDRLIDEFELLCHSVNVLGEASARAIDAISGLGEQMSVRVVAATLRTRGIPAEAVDATEIIVTTDHFGNAEPIHQPTRERARERLQPLLDRGSVPVVTGYIGATEQGIRTTLGGRGGSDYSAAIIGAMLAADEVMIYTDVDGVMTTDPRLVPEARVIAQLSYTEMSELAYFGAKVLHPRAVRPVVENTIPLRIRNTFNPLHPGTLVKRQVEPHDHVIKAVTCVRGLSLITVEGRGMLGVPGMAARTFSSVAGVAANVLMISQSSSEQSICFVVPMTMAAAVLGALEEGLATDLARRDIDRVSARDGVVIVTAVGAGMRETPGVASQVFGALAEHVINVIAIAQGSSECSISVVVDGADGDRAVQAIHRLTV